MNKVKAFLNKFFKIEERGSTIANELIGGLIIFLAMFYILPVNSFMVGGSGIEGASVGGVFFATAVSAAVATLIMGLLANFPVALAPGMGVNAFFTYTVCITLGYSYPQALVCVLISGVLFLIISLTNLRQTVLNAIPKNLKYAIGAGIGFFIAFIGFKNAGIIVSDASTQTTLGNLSNPTVLLAVFGIVLVLVLHNISEKTRRFAVIISLFATALIGVVLGACGVPNMPTLNGGSLSDGSDFFTGVGAFVKGFDVLAKPEAYAVIFSFLFVDFFDTAGTLVAVGTEANLVDSKGNLVEDKNALLADSIGTVVGACLGTPTVTSYIESTTGIAAGARTGLSASVTGVLFLLSLLIYPALGMFGSVMIDGVSYSPVTSLALVYVGTLMFAQVKEIDWKDSVAVAATFLVLILMLLTNSISDGIVFGMISYVVMMLAAKRHKEVHPILYALSALFIVYLVVKFSAF